MWLSDPGRGHTDHDLIAVSAGDDRTVVFCGDLVEESADPSIDDDSDTTAWPSTLDRVLAAGGEDAAYVPGHGAVVGAAFVRGQRRWLSERVTKLTKGALYNRVDLDFAYDLTLDEVRRRAVVLEAIGDDWDPVAALAGEQQAYDLLYSGRDEQQQRIYDDLVRAGVVPDRTVSRAAD